MKTLLIITITAIDGDTYRVNWNTPDGLGVQDFPDIESVSRYCSHLAQRYGAMQSAK